MLSLLSLFCFPAPRQARRLSQPESIEYLLLHGIGPGQSAEIQRAESLTEQRPAVQDGNRMIRFRFSGNQSFL